MLVLFNTALYTGLGIWQNNEIVSVPEEPDKVAILAVNKGHGFDVVPKAVIPVTEVTVYNYPVYVADPININVVAKAPPNTNILHRIMVTGENYTDAYERAERNQ